MSLSVIPQPNKQIKDFNALTPMLNHALALSKIGFWQFNINTQELFWSEITRKIHEVPEDYVPTVESGINFYKEGEHRKKISEAVSTAINEGKPWEVDLILVTYTKKEIWVRAKGR